jgi:hypothetical protein
MAVSVDWDTKVITVPQADLTFVTGTLYELDTNWLRLQLKDLEDDPNEGMVFLDTHRHNSTVTVAGITYARTIEIVNGYSIQFTPNSQWTVRLANSNNNFFDVEGGILVQNQVSVISTNSAGLQVVSAGSAVLPGDIADIAAAVWEEPTVSHTTTGTFGEKVGVKLLTVAKFLGLK